MGPLNEKWARLVRMAVRITTVLVFLYCWLDKSMNDICLIVFDHYLIRRNPYWLIILYGLDHCEEALFEHLECRSSVVAQLLSILSLQVVFEKRDKLFRAL